MNEQEQANCHDAVQYMYLFLDQELTAQETAQVRHHLDECIPCLEIFEFEVELRQLIARKCRDDVPESLRVRIIAALKCELDGSGKKLSEDGIPPI